MHRKSSHELLLSDKWKTRTTHQAELDMRRAVSTVPPRTTSFMPSTTPELAAPPTRGETRDLSASIGRSAQGAQALGEVVVAV